MPKLILRLEPLNGVAPPSAPAAAPADAAAPPPHVVDLGDPRRAPAASTPLSRWSAAVAGAHDPCLVLDAQGQVLSISTSAAALLGCSDAGVIGRSLKDVVDFVDFDTGASRPDYASRVAPLAVLTGGPGLMRSLLRVRHHDGSRVTIDAAAAPLHDGAGGVMGSMAFLSPIRG